ncbi:aminoglycoside phosphotransferase [Streptomyces sp. NPDC026672]|uniref:aminoglycoside phosphotransferase n=1 Tax=unclassified Streptomyces TaxID=2593676 RepID=UPI0033C6E700
MPAVPFDELPAPVREAVEACAGAFGPTRAVGVGGDGGAVLVLGADRGDVLVRAVPGPAATAADEAVADLLPGVCPRVSWRAHADGWTVLGYAGVGGRCADYSSAADLVLVLRALAEVQGAAAPGANGLATAEEHWGAYAEPGEAELFRGDTLLHAGWDPGDVLIDDGRVRLVGWGRALRGAAWIDPFLLALRIMAAGETAPRAVSWVQRAASWRASEPEAVGAFATAVDRYWRETAAADPAPWRAAAAVHAEQLKKFLVSTPWAVRP